MVKPTNGCPTVKVIFPVEMPVHTCQKCRKTYGIFAVMLPSKDDYENTDPTWMPQSGSKMHCPYCGAKPKTNIYREVAAKPHHKSGHCTTCYYEDLSQPNIGACETCDGDKNYCSWEDGCNDNVC